MILAIVAKENPGLKMSQAKAGLRVFKAVVSILQICSGTLLQDVGKIPRESEEPGQVRERLSVRLLAVCFTIARFQKQSKHLQRWFESV